MNLIQKRRLQKLAKLNAQNTASKSTKKDGKAKAPALSKMRQKLQEKKAAAEKLAVKDVAGKAEGGKVDDLESQVDGVEGSVDELKTDVESQSERTDELAGTVDDLSNELGGVKDDVSDLDSRVDSVEDDVQKIKEKLGDENEYVGNQELETHKVILAGSIDEMLNVEDIEDRKPYKAEAVVKLEAFVTGYVQSAAKYPNIVAVWIMIWLFDLGDIARAMPLALYLAAQKIQKMPTRFNSNIEAFICDQLYDWAAAQLKANKSAGPYLEQLINIIESEKWQLPDVVHGKMYAMYGKHLDAIAEDEAALKAYETAMDINSRAGVKKRIEQLRAKLKV
ncbi:phage terminase small subunit [Marinomonas arenicola]|uniref:phage terminase small subunit n=1 Tax=Marinomonas arenicola TaxID=569601 RepID=UPI00311F04B8